MTARDFKYWLRGWIELENPNRFTSKTLSVIIDHLDLVGEYDEFIVWLDGAISAALGTKKGYSIDFFRVVDNKLLDEFSKVTPDRKEEIKKAVDSVLTDKEHIQKLINDVGKTCRPLDVGPGIYHQGSCVDTGRYTVFC